MSKQALLTQAIQNYQFDDMQTALDELSVEDKTLLIGVLGEFSSGKSSLINAMLGQTTLLAFDNPTTAAIVEIAPQNNITSNTTFIRQPDGQLTAISPHEFDEFVLKGEKNLVGVLNVPSSKILVEGYRIVDTPGIVSLEDTHEDITFGYLPFLDGAIVCQDINKGGLTHSLKEFLSKPDVRPFLDKIIFVQTRSDTKPPAAVQIIRESFINDLTELYQSCGLSLTQASKRVLCLSPKKILANQDINDLETLQNTFQEIFISSKQSLLATKTVKLEEKLAKNVITRLQLVRENLSLDRSEYALHKKMLEEDIVNIQQEQAKYNKALDDVQYQIQEHITVLLQRTTPRLIAAENTKQMSEVLNGLAESISAVILPLIKKQFSQFGHVMFKIDNHNLQQQIQDITKQTEFFRMVGTALLGAILTWSSAGGLTAAQGVIAGGATKVVLNEAFSKIVQQVNPVDWLADYVGKKQRASIIQKEVVNIGQEISVDIIEHVRNSVNNDIIEPQKAALQAAEANLNNLLKDETNDIAKLNQERAAVDQLILALLA